MITIKDPLNLSLVNEALELLLVVNGNTYPDANIDKIERDIRNARKRRIHYLRSCIQRSLEVSNKICFEL